MISEPASARNPQRTNPKRACVALVKHQQFIRLFHTHEDQSILVEVIEGLHDQQVVTEREILATRMRQVPRPNI